MKEKYNVLFLILFFLVFPVTLLSQESTLYSITSTEPSNILFILDKSGSMGWQISGSDPRIRMNVLKESMVEPDGVLDLLLENPADINVGLASFSSGFSMLKDMAIITSGGTSCSDCPDSSQNCIGCFRQKVNGLHPGGGTQMGNALRGGYNYFKSGTGNSFVDTCRHNGVILISDGEPNDPNPENQAAWNYEGHIATEALNPAWGASCVDDSSNVGYCPGNKVATHTIAYAQYIAKLETIANSGGGTYSPANDKQQLKDAIANITALTTVKSVVTSAAPASLAMVASKTHENILYVPSFWPKTSKHWWGTVSKLCFMEEWDDTNSCMFKNVTIADGSYAYNTKDKCTDEEKYEGQLKAITEEMDATELFTNMPYRTIAEAPTDGYKIGINKTVKDMVGSRQIYKISSDETEFENHPVSTSNERDRFLQGYEAASPLTTRVNPLGDIFHSSPTPLEFGKKKYMFVGGNSGFLHVINDDTGAEVRAVVPTKELWDKHENLDFNNNTDHISGVDGSVARMNVNSVDWTAISMRRGSRGYTFVKTKDLIDGGAGKKAVRWKVYCDNSIGSSADCTSNDGIWEGGRCDTYDEDTCVNKLLGTFKEVFGYAWSSPVLEEYNGTPYLLAPFGYDNYFDEIGAVVGDYDGAINHGYKVEFKNSGPIIDIHQIDSYGFKNSTGKTYPVTGTIFGFDWKGNEVEQDVTYSFDTSYNGYYYVDLVGDLYTCYETSSSPNCGKVLEFAGASAVTGQDLSDTTNLALVKSFGSAKPVVRNGSDTIPNDREVWVFYGTGDLINPFVTKGGGK